MKKLLVLLIILVLVACARQPATLEQRAPAENATPAVTVTPAENIAPAVEVTPAEQREEADEELRQKVIAQEEARIQEALAHPEKFAPRNRSNTVGDALSDTFSTIKSYQYRTTRGTFFVLGDKIRYVLTDPIRITHVSRAGENYSEIYLDEVIIGRGAKTATGYCAGFTDAVRKQCANLQLFDLDFPLVYDSYNPKLPEDWSREFSAKEVSNEGEQKYYLNSIETTLVQFADGTAMYISPKAGLPIKVVTEPLVSTTFDNLVVNQVKPENVIHRSRADIPPDEVFHSTY